MLDFVSQNLSERENMSFCSESVILRSILSHTKQAWLQFEISKTVETNSARIRLFAIAITVTLLLCR